MNIINLMIPMSLLLGFGFLAAFLVAMNSEQFEDLDTPAQRMLIDETEKGKQHE